MSNDVVLEEVTFVDDDNDAGDGETNVAIGERTFVVCRRGTDVPVELTLGTREQPVAITYVSGEVCDCRRCTTRRGGHACTARSVNLVGVNERAAVTKLCAAVRAAAAAANFLGPLTRVDRDTIVCLPGFPVLGVRVCTAHAHARFHSAHRTADGTHWGVVRLQMQHELRERAPGFVLFSSRTDEGFLTVYACDFTRTHVEEQGVRRAVPCHSGQ